MKEEYLNELSNIEVQYKQFAIEKENEKNLMKKEIENKQETIKKITK